MKHLPGLLLAPCFHTSVTTSCLIPNRLHRQVKETMLQSRKGLDVIGQCAVVERCVAYQLIPGVVRYSWCGGEMRQDRYRTRLEEDMLWMLSGHSPPSSNV